MNKDNVKVSIRAVTEQKNFSMSQWFVKKSCGMVACIGGCTALTPEWEAQGGTTAKKTQPMFRREGGYRAMAEFWNISIVDAINICGEEEFYGC